MAVQKESAVLSMILCLSHIFSQASAKYQFSTSVYTYEGK